jgi:CheY-like chemotaxis protein
MGDANRLQQVFWNLLSNAVKFTPLKGAIEIILREVDDFAEIIIRDTGIGISADFLPFVFERFVQAESAATRRHGGLGLGLSIVRNLVEMHGGTVAVDSAGEGRGATFTIVLPVATAAAKESSRSTAAAVRLDGLRVLVVDDDSSALLGMQALLEDRGAQVVTASSGNEARAVLGRAQPDVVVSDIRLPDDDGYSLLRSLRERVRDLPAVAVTAFDGLEGRSRALEAGYQAHLAKPIEPELLVSTIAMLAATSPPN